MTTRKEPSIKEQVIQILSKRGPLKLEDMMSDIKGAEKHSVDSKVHEMLNGGQLTRDSDMVYTLKGGVTAESVKENPAGAGDAPPKTSGTGAPLDPRPLFEGTCKGVGLKPEFIPSIAELFFKGDIDDLAWLKEVLTRHSAGFVSNQQARFILASWGKTRNLPFDPDEFAVETPETARGAKAAAEAPAKSAQEQLEEETGIKYKVEKDKDGDWVPKPGGTLTYEAALSHCEKQNYIKAVERGQAAEAADSAQETSDAKAPARPGKGSRSFEQMLMEKMIDRMFDDDKGRGREDSVEMKALRDEVRRSRESIDQMREQQDREWRERIEATLAEAVARDPLGDTRSVEALRQRLGVSSSNITDSSPAVQLIKDSTDKLDKSLARTQGLFERWMMQSDQFRPEEKRSSAEKESKAGELLDEAERKARLQNTRKAAFNL